MSTHRASSTTNAGNAYQALAEAHDDARWAFGTGFDDPLSGVDTTLPDDVPGGKLAEYCLMLGDDALIAAHRLQEWCTNAPELEDEVAIANISLDLLGQARLLLARAGRADGTGRSEDHYAYFRDEHEFRNVRLVERPHTDFADLAAFLLLFGSWRLALLGRLTGARDPVLAAIAGKAVKELSYHREYAAGWVVRLGDGTELSRRRMIAALDRWWPFVDELFHGHPAEIQLATLGVAVDPAYLRGEFDTVLASVLSAGRLSVPDGAPVAGVAGRTGRHGLHTEALGGILTELQGLARAHPEATW
ncbi:ring-1,2-phenylacetyl-CoA epoxidase subunit PaaC [Tamaricihabitans halophyticus]|uniref:Ring-1,2-phenylacetyl-CoA epoxidase subunit PaaC n=1 Tax=Tamaricihabitans halophyticus TaxID=1262583 RepID=A0A4R2QKQ6_9PSEU|nr:1,2-phenylacetyl-CoA epoxidase subunit PaaC [Tamaricihabitans halophyticus]TCP50023.1 ring-1,2-phenylacetyl-CoA epoxidase subunit PaaC [Tamaricihabitans halophyticus]